MEVQEIPDCCPHCLSPKYHRRKGVVYYKCGSRSGNYEMSQPYWFNQSSSCEITILHTQLADAISRQDYWFDKANEMGDEADALEAQLAEKEVRLAEAEGLLKECEEYSPFKDGEIQTLQLINLQRQIAKYFLTPTTPEPEMCIPIIQTETPGVVDFLTSYPEIVVSKSIQKRVAIQSEGNCVVVRRDYAEQILSALEEGTIEHIRMKAALDLDEGGKG